MVDYVLPNSTTVKGPLDLIVYTSGQIDLLAPGILLLVFCTIWLAGYGLQRRGTGKASFATWSAIAGMVTTVIAFMMMLTPGIISLPTVITVLVITIVCCAFAVSSVMKD